MTGKFSSNLDYSDHESLYKEYDAHMRLNDVKDKTRGRRLADARVWLDWCSTNNHDPLNITTMDIRRFLKSHRDKWADTTINRRFTSLTKIYDWIATEPEFADQWTGDNPVDDIDLNDELNVVRSKTRISENIDPDEDEDEKLAIKEDVVDEMVDAVDAARESTEVMRKLIIRLMWDTALRSEELSKVRWKNVNPEDREIKVNSSKLKSDHDLSTRTVFYTSETQRLLKKWLVTHRSSKSPHADDSPYLLPTEQSERMNPSTISRKIKEAAHKAGVNEPLVVDDNGNVKQWLITAHRLRHSRITQLANIKSYDKNALRRMAGHTDIETTLGYVHQDWDSDREKYRRAVE